MKPSVVLGSFVLLVVACNGDPAPNDAGIEAGLDAQALDLGFVDRPGPDVGIDAGGGTDIVDVFVATDPAPILDRGTDVGMDAGADAADAGNGSDAGCSSDAPVPCPCGFTSGVRECRSDGTLGVCLCGEDAGATDAAADVPVDRPDVRIFCGAGPDQPCRTHDDCSVCIPSPTGFWCCRAAQNTCYLTSSSCP